MKNKKNVIILLGVVLVLVIGGGIYKSVSEHKFKNLDVSWGMGTKVTQSISNNRDYEWYVDQMATGRNAVLNCAPTTVEMVAKWQDENSSIKTKNIVDKYIPEGIRYNGVDSFTLYNWLVENGINTTMLKDLTEDSLTAELDKGNIVIVGLDLKYITYNSNSLERVGLCLDIKNSPGNAWHYVIAKGYKEVDDKLYFETYDPFSNYQKYDDGQLIGQNRYYISNEFIEAANMYFPDVIVIEKTK
ncbi:MAG: hypothetical protein RR636_13460 [Clostridium sp.]|uniref:hypothetical protein n=1 Tax=Clostridium sp. TaxID=1506 RepID=UPI00302B8565